MFEETGTPYQYAYQNPIKYIDPTGMLPEDGSGDPPKRSWFGRNISQPVGNFFKRLFNPFPAMDPDYQGSQNKTEETIPCTTCEVGPLEKDYDFNTEETKYYGDPFSGLAEVTTQGIQWVGELITGNEVSEETANNIQLATDLIILVSSKGKSAGRLGKQKRLIELANDPKLGKADKGWIKSEMRQVKNKKRKSIRNPPGKDLAHERGREAAKGYSYKYSKLQNRKDHRAQHKYDNGGRKNKERPVNE